MSIEAPRGWVEFETEWVSLLTCGKVLRGATIEIFEIQPKRCVISLVQFYRTIVAFQVVYLIGECLFLLQPVCICVYVVVG